MQVNNQSTDHDIRYIPHRLVYFYRKRSFKKNGKLTLMQQFLKIKKKRYFILQAPLVQKINLHILQELS